MRAFADKPKPPQLQASLNPKRSSKTTSTSQITCDAREMQSAPRNQGGHLLASAGEENLETTPKAALPTRFVHDFSRVPLHAQTMAKNERKREDEVGAQARWPGIRARIVANRADETDLPRVIENEARLSGTDLPARARLEHAFGVDLGGIRTVVGGAVGHALMSMGAYGVAVRNTVAFAPAPEIALVAHEVAHLIQSGKAPRRDGSTSVMWEGREALEAEAHAASAVFAGGGRPDIRLAATEGTLWDRGVVIAPRQVVVRTRPATDHHSRVVCVIAHGEPIEVIGTDTPGWAFIEWHRQRGYVSISAIRPDPAPTTPLMNWPREIRPALVRDGINWGKIYEFEGYHPEGEVPGPGSGVTVAHGIDLAERGEAWLRARGFSRSIVNKLRHYGPPSASGGRRVEGTEARQRLQDHPLRLSHAECAELDAWARESFTTQVTRDYAAASGGLAFSDLPGAAQTVAISLCYHYGSLTSGNPLRLLQLMAMGDWGAVIRLLRRFGDTHSRRRNEEADYLTSIFAPPDVFRV